ncbi:hypothetical protein [Paraburkholderia sediminicola]|uniref:hypothetical protein n=1 Tax=Paraburkholderia sediminicola TaxID=458836 RepID=UPI0038B6C96A
MENLNEAALVDSAPTDSARQIADCIAIVIVGVHHELSKMIAVDEQRFAGNPCWSAGVAVQVSAVIQRAAKSRVPDLLHL